MAEKPLAPATHWIDVDRHSNLPAEFMSRRRQKCIKYGGCSAAVLLILVVTILILMLTVFHVKDPILTLNAFKIDGLDLLSGKNNTHRGLNLTVVADLSVKNPNSASFKFEETTTVVYYDGSVVGEVRTAAGRVAARKTLCMNALVDVMVDKIVEVGRFKSDLIAGVFPVSTFTSISGKVKITDVIKKSFVVEMNCTMNVDVSRQVVQDRHCRRIFPV